MTTQYQSATDFRKSLEERLKRLATATGQDLQRLRRKVAFDRLLARIFHGKEGSKFLLKGGYAMELRFDKARATRDIDLTYLERFKQNPEPDISEEILQELRDISQIDLKDFFVYRIGDAQMDLDNAPYGGARFPVSSFIDGRLFVRFQIDIGLEVVVNKIDKVKGLDWLEFCKIPTSVISMITKEQQFAEKIHAYTLPRVGRMNSRVKDFIDLLLLLNHQGIDEVACNNALHTVFRVRGTHPLPEVLLTPPVQWEVNFKKMALECGLKPDMTEAYEYIDSFFQKIVSLTDE